MTDDRIVRKLRAQLESALAKRKDDDAIKLIHKLITAEPKAPRWPHKLGEMYQKKGRKVQAIEQFSVAASLYADQGFIARAIAMAKTVFDMDPTRIDVLEKIDPEAASRLHRKQRPRALSAPVDQLDVPGSGAGNSPPPPPPRPMRRAHAAVLPEDGAPPPRAHAAVLPEDDAPPPRRHAAVVPEEDAPPKRHPAVIAEDDEPPPPPRGRLAPPPPPARPAAPPPPVLELEDEDEDEDEEEEDDLDIDLDSRDLIDQRLAPPRLPDLAASVMDLAEELTIAPDVAPNETRFSNAPPKPTSLRVQLTDSELKDRRPQKVHSLPPAPPSPVTLSKLPLFPLFAELPREALVELVKASDVIEVGHGEVVIRAGDPSDALYGIIEGSVEVSVPGQSLKLTLAEGDVFGESCLLAGEKRRADVVVAGRLVAIRISRQVFNQVIAVHPRIAEVLLDLLTRRLLSNLLQASPLFQELDARGRQQMAQLFEVRRAPRGTVLADFGKNTDGLYITLTGVLQVCYEDGTIEQRDVGTMFGQRGMLTHEPSDVLIRALTNMLVLRLPTSAFHSVVMQYPGMLAHLSEMTATSVADVGM